MRDIKSILEGIVSQAKPVGSGGSAFRHSSSSGTKGRDHGIDVGAHRNQAHEVRAKEATLDNAKKREQEVEKRNREAEQRQKETMKMAKEETVTEAKKFVFDKPHPAMVKAYDKRDTSELHGMHKRWSSDHSNPKNNPETSEKLLAVHHVLKSRGENVGELPKHKNLGLTMHEETNTEKRMKIKNVARPDDAAPTSEKSTLAKTGEIKTKIIEDKPTMSVPNFGLSASLINAARQIVEKKHEDDGADAKKMTGGKTAVELEPETNDKMEDSDNKPAKKKSHTVPKTDKEKKLAALASPKDKITHKDVLVGRGVVKEDEQLDERERSQDELVKKWAHHSNRAYLSQVSAKRAKADASISKDPRDFDIAKGHERQAELHKKAQTAAGRRIKTEDEQLDELSPITLAGYIKRASDDRGHLGMDTAAFGKDGQHKRNTDIVTTHPTLKKTMKKWNNRQKGIERAADKMLDKHFESVENIGFSDEEIARIEAIAAQLDEAKPTIVSAPIRGANQDQSGIGTKSSSTDYTISDSKKMKLKEEMAHWTKHPDGGGYVNVSSSDKPGMHTVHYIQKGQAGTKSATVPSSELKHPDNHAKPFRMNEEVELDESFVVYHKDSKNVVSTHVNHATAKKHAEKKGSDYSVASKSHWHANINPKRSTTNEETNLDEARGRPRKNPLPAGQEADVDDTHKHPMQQLEKIAHSIAGNEPHFEHKDGSKTKVGKNLARHMVVTHNSMKTTQEKNSFADKLHANRDSMRSEMGKHF